MPRAPGMSPRARAAAERKMTRGGTRTRVSVQLFGGGGVLLGVGWLGAARVLACLAFGNFRDCILSAGDGGLSKAPLKIGTPQRTHLDSSEQML